MAWNEPGNGQKDPWNRNRSSGRKPDIDAAISGGAARTARLRAADQRPAGVD